MEGCGGEAVGGWGGKGVAWVEVVGVGGAVVMMKKREREIVYFYRWGPHEHILRGDDKAPGGKTDLHVAAT